jgi:hypothetical protein
MKHPTRLQREYRHIASRYQVSETRGDTLSLRRLGSQGVVLFLEREDLGVVGFHDGAILFHQLTQLSHLSVDRGEDLGELGLEHDSPSIVVRINDGNLCP